MKTLTFSALFVLLFGLPSFAEDSIEGIGAALALEDSQIVVQDVFPGSPAEKGGVHKKDTILAVDGHSLAGKSLKQVVKIIRGPAGTLVSLTLSDGVGHVRETHMFRQKFVFGTPPQDCRH